MTLLGGGSSLSAASQEPKITRLNLYCRDGFCLLAIALLILNDHGFKHSPWRGVVTGKLSDVAGVYFFPFLLVDLWNLVMGRARGSWAVFISACLITAALMTGLKTSAPVRRAYRQAYALAGVRVTVVGDQTDLLALLMLPLAVWRFATLRRRVCDCAQD